MEKDRTNVLLKKDTMISLKNLARYEGKSLTMLITEAIEEYLGKKERAKDFEIIGIGSSSKSDISENTSKYAKGGK